MDDIVERIRSVANERAAEYVYTTVKRDELHRWADEIERLRAALTKPISQGT